MAKYGQRPDFVVSSGHPTGSRVFFFTKQKSNLLSRLDCRRHCCCNRVSGLPESIISWRRFDRFKIGIYDYDFDLI